MAENEQLDKVLEHLDSLHSKIDEQCASHKKLAERMDAFEEQARKDAKEKAKDDKARADAAATDALQRTRIAAIEREMEEEKPKLAEAQMRADTAYQALSLGQAPPSLYGEKLPDYRVRLLSRLKQYSNLYKGSNLASLAVADEAAFAGVESSIINDAVEASCAPPPVGHALREREVRTPSGHIRREFFGDPAMTWAPFMGGGVQIGRINRPKL